MQQASIYKLIKKNKFLMHSVSRLKMGASMASAPFIWLDGDKPTSEIAEQLKYSLSKSAEGLPNPANWKASAKDFLKNIGLRKQSDLYKDSVLVGLTVKEGTMAFTPMKNLASKGFINVSKEKIEIPENANIGEMVNALENAFSKCE